MRSYTTHTSIFTSSSLAKCRKLRPFTPGPSEEDASLPKLPQSLEQALDDLVADRAFCDMLGPDFITLFTAVKRHELARFRGAITDWERNEYMEVF